MQSNGDHLLWDAMDDAERRAEQILNDALNEIDRAIPRRNLTQASMPEIDGHWDTKFPDAGGGSAQFSQQGTWRNDPSLKPVQPKKPPRVIRSAAGASQTPPPSTVYVSLHTKRGTTHADERNTLHITGQVISTHRRNTCLDYWCAVHNPSPHHMRDWPQQWDDIKNCIVRVCTHGQAHIDPDNNGVDARFYKTHHQECDGCCIPQVTRGNNNRIR